LPEYTLSVLIPAFNRADQTIAAVQSVGQRDDVQIVVIDDGSDPGTYAKLVEELAPYKGVKLSHNDTNIGMVNNWNKCIDNADGSWMSLLCCDDHFKAGAVDRIVELVRNSQPALILQDPSIAEDRLSIGRGVEVLRKLRLPIVSGNVWHRDACRTLGGFDTRLKYSPDGEFWYRIASVYQTVLVREPFAVYECHADNYMWKTWREDDFLQQVELLARINAGYLLPDAPRSERDRFVEERLWATLETVLATSCSPGREDIYLRYLPQMMRRIDRYSRFLRFARVVAGARRIPVRSWVQSLCKRR
jgi:glycosyltransferase involved in cell wall biosynthesis